MLTNSVILSIISTMKREEFLYFFLKSTNNFGLVFQQIDKFDDLSIENYNKILRLKLSSIWGESAEIIKTTIETILNQLISLFQEEKVIHIEDYVAIAESFELLLSEQMPLSEKRNLLMFFKDKINELQKTYSTESDSEFAFMENFKQAIVKKYNSLVESYSSMFNVENVYNNYNIEVNVNLENFRNSLISYMEKYDLQFYISNEKLIKYLRSLDKEKLEDLYKFLEFRRKECLEFYKKIIEDLKIKLTNEPDNKFIKDEISKFENLLKYYSSNFIDSPEMIKPLLFEEGAFSNAKENIFGRLYKHRELTSKKLNKKNKKSIIEQVIDRYNSKLNFEIRDDKDLIDTLSALKNILLFLNTDVLANFNSSMISYAFDYGETFSNKKFDSKIQEICKQLRFQTDTMRGNQQEFALNQNMIQKLIKINKFLYKTIKNENGVYTIYTAEDYGVKYIFIKEKIELKNEIEEILYFLPDGKLEHSQQIMRVDYAKTDSLLKHSPTGDNPIISSIAHVHTYDIIDVLFKSITNTGNSKQKRLGHYEIDRVLSQFIEIGDIDNYFKKYAHTFVDLQDMINLDLF